MSDDLKTGEEVEQEAIFEIPDPCAEISAACQAISAMDELDGALLNEADKRRKARILRRSIAIIDSNIKYLYDCLGEEE